MNKTHICSFAILICVVLSCFVVMNRTAASASAAPQEQADKPVEQTRKNIQVLKGLPESQLFILMNLVSTSLGVTCEYCHVKNPGKNPQTGDENWAWESDAKPKKLVGRRMIQMVLDINRTSFEGRTSVTCYTCHRGSTEIARVPPLPPHDPIRSEAAKLPTAEQILATYIAAVGGKDAAAKFKTTVIRGTVERSEGRNPDYSLIRKERPLEVTVKDADKYLIVWTTPQGVTTAAINGEAGWIKTSAGVRPLTGRTLQQPRRATVAYYSAIKVIAPPAQMRVVGTEKIGDRDAYVLALRVDADTTTRFFFDTKTGLLLRELTTTRTMLAPLPEQIDFEDYRDVGGVKLPFTIRSSDAATFDTAVRRFKEVKHNVAVDDSVFNAPPAGRQ